MAETAGDQSPAVGNNAGTFIVNYGRQPFEYSLRTAWVPLDEHVSDPSRLLRARAALVPYLDRAGHVEMLSRWLVGPEPFSVAVIGGRGGAGKTRLAVQLCSAVPVGWISGFLGPLPPEAIPHGQVAAGNSTGLGMLVVIDYAETRVELQDLLPALQHAAGPARPVRVLLLVRRAPQRGAAWSSVLRTGNEELDAILLDIAASHEVILEEREWDLETRENLYRWCWDAFARRAEYVERARPSDAPSPPDLSAPGFGNPLLVTATAYLAVHEPELNTPGTREDLLEAILKHEASHWFRTAHEANPWSGNAKRPEDPDGIITRRTTAMAALAGADGEIEGAKLLRHVPDLKNKDRGIRMAWARWYQAFYQGPRFWIPLEPDLLGEHLIATTLTKFPSTIAASINPVRGPNVAQPLTLISRIAATSQSWDAYPGFNAAAAVALQKHLAGLTRVAIEQAGTPRTPIPAGTTIASALSQAVGALSGHLSDVSDAIDALPRHSIPRVNVLAVSLTRHQLAWLRSKASDAPASVSSEEALTGNFDGAKILYDPEEAASLACSPDFANALYRYSIALTASGSREAALSTITKAVRIRRNLVDQDRQTHLPALSVVLHEQAIALTELGRKEAAVDASDEAVQIQLELADSPETDLHALANALNEKSIALGRSGNHKDALSYIIRAEEIFRGLAESHPDKYMSELAKALNNKSNRLARVGDSLEEALRAINGAVEIRRRQAAANPDAYLPNLATALNNQSNRLEEAGKYKEALASIIEAVSIRSDLAREHPESFLKDLATARNNLSRRLGHLGRDEEALSEIEEAVRVRRDLAVEQPEVFRKDLATALNNLSIRQSILGLRREALESINDSLDIRRPMAEAEPPVFRPNLATALNNQSSAYASLGRYQESLAAAREAAEIRSILFEEDPDAFRAALASALNNKSNSQAAMGLHDDALATINTSLEMRRLLAERRREAFISDLSTALNNASNRLAQQGRYDDALATASEAVEIRRGLARELPDVFLLKLATTLNNQSNILVQLGRYEDALVAIAEAKTVLLDLVKLRPQAVRPYLATVLNTQSNVFACLGQLGEAVTSIKESVELFQELVALFPDAFRRSLATARTNQSLRIRDLNFRRLPR